MPHDRFPRHSKDRRGPTEIPAWLLKVCFALCVANLTLGVVAYSSHWWIYDQDGRGIPTDFINVWAAGRLVLDGLPAQAYNWDMQKQIEVAKLGQDFVGYFAWHYPPPFLFVASVLAQLPYSVAFLGWVLVSMVPYLAAMRAIIGRNSEFCSRCRSDGVRQCAGRTERFSYGGADRRYAL